MISQVVESKRDKLVHSAAVVFARQGFAVTRVADIAAEAGVGKGTVYEYFPSKDALYLAVLERLNDSIRERIARLLEGQSSPLGKLRALLIEGARIVVEQRELYPMSLDFWAASRGTAAEVRFSAACERQYREYRALLAEILREGKAAGEIRSGVDPEGVATLLVATFDGLGMQCWLDPELDAMRASAAFADALCAGVCEPRS